MQDAEWIADLLKHGLLKASFIPDKAQRELRELVTYRKSLVKNKTAEMNRLQKMLEGANIKLSGTVYDDPVWKDRLTAYDDVPITYDAIGNPLTWYTGAAFTWQHGRQLAGYTLGDTSVSYLYNADGIRTAKTVNGITTHYTVTDGTLRRLTNGSDTLQFVYGNGLSSVIYNGTEYWYVFNAQHDVVGIIDAGGEYVVRYTYDSWGKLLTKTGSMADTLGTLNPFRYRGYIYDEETALYYCQSRYYDPEIGRFLNADAYVATGELSLSHNMYAYCENNPVNCFDPTGYFSLLNIWEEFIENISENKGGFVVVGGIAMGDSPAPGFLDLAALGLAGILIFDSFGKAVQSQSSDSSLIKPLGKTIVKEKTNQQSSSNGTTYYHTTTLEYALLIKLSGVMTGSIFEAGYVYAWKQKPNNYAIQNSGAHFGVTISFKTNASFESDNGITDSDVLKYGPVRSMRPGPIRVWDVEIHF